jgi:uncharacterized membrane protein YgcG
MPRIARLVAVLGIAALAVLPASPAAAARADVDDFDIASFDADYLLSRDADGHATLAVTETIVAVFPEFDQNRGLIRDIPEYYNGVRLSTEVIGVVDERGEPVPYTTEYYLDFFSVLLGDDDFVHGSTTYVISYVQRDTIRPFKDTGADEFYWDVNGTGWSQPFGRVTGSVTIAPDLVPALTGQAACYAGGSGCDHDLVRVDGADGSAAFDAAATGLGPLESLTVAIAFAPGTFVPGEEVIPPPSLDPAPTESLTWWERFGSFLLAPAAIGVALLAGVTQVTDRTARTRASGTIVPQYTVPEGVNVMVAAYVAGFPERAFPAQVVSLAVRGRIRILDHPDDRDEPFALEVLDAGGLDPLESRLVDAIFGDGARPGVRRSLPRGGSALGSRVTPVYKAVEARLKSEGLRRGSRPTVLWTVLAALAVVIVVVAGLDVLRGVLGGDEGITMIALIAAVWGAARTWNRRSTRAELTEKGRGWNDYLLGMRDYLELAEEDRIRVLQSPEGAERVNVDDRVAMVKLWERLLPFAVIWGVEDRWSEELAVRALAAGIPVDWLAGSGDLSAWQMRSTLQGVRGATPAPPRPVVARAASSGGWSSGRSGGGWSGSSGSSSFSGGSSGGGYSGGGGGGGGGRGR